jgi:hypothetical protein
MTQPTVTQHRYERNVNPAIGKVNVCLFCSEQYRHPNHIGAPEPEPRVPKPQSPKQAAYLFFLRNAGTSYNPQRETRRQGQSRCARQLAKAERDARGLGYRFEWADDWSVGSHVGEFGEESYPAEPNSCESCRMISPDGQTVQSRGCVDDATDAYRRVVEAELALEQLSQNGN